MQKKDKILNIVLKDDAKPDQPAAKKVNLTKGEVIEIFNKHDFMLGRMISGSKSMYRQKYPDNLVIFNSNIIIESLGKVWHGDVDITREAATLKAIANDIGENLYILYEMDARFGNEDSETSVLMSRAKYIVKCD